MGTECPGYKKGVEIHIFFPTPMRKYLDRVSKDNYLSFLDKLGKVLSKMEKEVRRQ